MNANANDSTRSPFVVPGHGIPEPQPRRTPQGPTRDAGTNHNPFRWVVPSEEVGHESPAVPAQDHIIIDHEPTQRTDHNDRTSDGHNNDALDRTGQPRRTIPTTRPVPETGDHSSIPKIPTIPTSGYGRLLDDRDDEDDDRTSVNGHSEDERVPPLMDSFGNINRVLDDETDGDSDSTGDRDATLGDPQSRVSTGAHGGDGDQPMTTSPRRSNVTVSDSVSYAMDSSRLREGVQIGTVKRELIEYRPKARRTPRQTRRLPFSPQIPKVLDFLTRWRIGTTVQLARVAGWRDPNKNRILKKLRSYDEVGFMRETDIYAGPKIWTATEHGAELGFHSWLGGVKSKEINPMSQSHTFGLSSIASWLLCPWDDTPNVLGLTPDEWSQVRGEIKDGTAYVIAEREYRSSYSSIRTTRTGLIPPEYRHGFIGCPGGQTPVPGAWREWARRFKNGDSTLADSPELLACDPEFMGENLWMWIIWGNGVWNPKVLETRAGQEVDLDDLSWAGRDGESRLRAEFRRYGYVPIEERLDYASNKPVLNKALGDRFALWDHLPDLIIARRRTDDGYADPQSIAIELELSAKTPEAYARTMAAYGSQLGQTLYRKVIWLVPSKTIAVQIRAGASQVGMILGEDYEIVPFVTSNEASVIKRSFYSGADILPGCWTKRGTIEPCEDGRSIPLA